MIDIITNEMMRTADRHTIDVLGIAGEELMMRASMGILDEVSMYDNIAIVVGKGNNGGDGICLAKLLIDRGKTPHLYMFTRETKGESKYYYEQIKDYDNIYVITGNEDYSRYDVVVDAIFGTGFDREAVGIYRATIDAINRTSRYTISVDIPSGMSGNNGMIYGEAVKADKTISIGTRKLGQYLGNGKDYAGIVVNKEIGIPLVDEPYYLVEDSDVIMSHRLHNTNKGTYGTVSILGGSTNYLGALKLACLGTNALMSGAGIVRLCMPSEYVSLYGANVLECTLYPLTSKGGSIVFSESELQPLLGSRVIAIGMGIGNSRGTVDIVRYLVENYTGRLLIDADGLNALSTCMDILTSTKAKIVITPHPGEMSRLIDKPIGYVLADPVGVAKTLALEYNITVLLKGASTVVTDGTKVFIVDRGSPCMAKGGSGDVLSGIISGLLANKDLDTLTATYYGAYLAGEAGEMAGKEYGDYGALARDTARYTAYAIKNHIV